MNHDARYKKALNMIIEELVEEMGHDAAYVYCARNRSIVEDMAKSRSAMMPYRDLDVAEKKKSTRRRKKKVNQAVTA